MNVKDCKFLIAILLLTSCKTDPKKEFSKKIKVGVCQEHQGMVTFEADLYSDSTFYQSGNTLVDYSYGEFKLSSQGIRFKTLDGEQNFCPEYIYDKKSNSYFSSKNCTSDPINIYWMPN
jgi:hypothetical protein